MICEIVGHEQMYVVMKGIGIKLIEEHDVHYLQVSCVRFFQFNQVCLKLPC
jgi:hypothetical protein